MTIDEICELAHKTSTEKGFWDEVQDEKTFLLFSTCTKLMLIVTEIAEACEAIRKTETAHTLGEELADAVIRIADLAEALKIDLDYEIKKKMEINKHRPKKHNKRF
jgi:NTP pyrophosphatase (non-canonical NTP hydrolase)